MKLDTYPLAQAGAGARVVAGAGKCSLCAYRQLCLPQGLSDYDLASIEGMVGCRRRVGRDEPLFRAGQAFGNLYAVRFGHFMTCRNDERGQRYVTGFQMAGELLGMDGIGGIHACTAIALEDSEVCEIPYGRLRGFLADYPELMEHFHRLMGQEIRREQAVLYLLGVLRADERLACLLVNLSARYAMRGFSPRRFALRMSRDDIARHLGLTFETVSRLIARFRDQGLIAIERRDVEILDMPALETLAAGTRPSVAA